jgi:uncharacterized surface protein with fasciclin (FAS1) repeats
MVADLVGVLTSEELFIAFAQTKEVFDKLLMATVNTLSMTENEIVKKKYFVFAAKVIVNQLFFEPNLKTYNRFQSFKSKSHFCRSGFFFVIFLEL